jgi:hypothetical protein
MRAYRNIAWGLIDNFFLTFNITAIPRFHNMSANALVVASGTFRPPSTPHLKHKIEMWHIPSIPNNTKHWQVFEDANKSKKKWKW